MTQAAKSLTKRTFRDRYYSSMNFEEYYLLFGPPTPIVKYFFYFIQDLLTTLHKTYLSYVWSQITLEINFALPIKSTVYVLNMRLQTKKNPLMQMKINQSDKSQTLRKKGFTIQQITHNPQTKKEAFPHRKNKTLFEQGQRVITPST